MPRPTSTPSLHAMEMHIFGSFAELKDRAVIGPVSVVGPFADERVAADHVRKWGRFNTDVGDR